jgi:hypothetical protein
MAGDKQHVTEGASIQATPAVPPVIGPPPPCGAPSTDTPPVTCTLPKDHLAVHSWSSWHLSPTPKGTVS